MPNHDWYWYNLLRTTMKKVIKAATIKATRVFLRCFPFFLVSLVKLVFLGRFGTWENFRSTLQITALKGVTLREPRGGIMVGGRRTR